MKRTRSFAGTKKLALSCAALLMALSAAALFAYNTFQVNTGTVQTPTPIIPRWSSLPVAWLANLGARPANNVTTTGCSATLDASGCILQSLTEGFATWTSALVGTQSLTDLSVTYSGTSTLQTPVVDDCQNVVGFSDSASDFSTGTIAFTQLATVTASQYTCSGGATKTCSLPACIADADIEFNPNYTFYTDTAPSGTAFDLQAVATHEEGHLLGMDHSGIGHTVMFPFGDTAASGQTLSLSEDDAIGISFLYPCTSATSGPSCTASFSASTGTISGKVTLGSSGAFGAQVVAIDTSTGDVAIDGLTNTSGDYNLVGVPPGNYHILALPLAPDVNSGLVVLDDFGGWECGYGDVNCNNIPLNPTNYTGRYY